MLFSANHDGLLDRIATSLATLGYIILDSALCPVVTEQLRVRARSLAIDDLSQAGIGRSLARQLNTAIRADRIHWLDPQHPVDAAYLKGMEQLRQGLNRRLFLGLFDYESHYAVYCQGAYYRRHVDAFQGERNRVVTTTCYLNDAWRPRDGGELLLYGPSGDSLIERVQPLLGRLVIFLSDQFPHEVLTTHRTRYSIAGWFRVNTAAALGPHISARCE
jgi:SM-20-related protein